MSALVLIAANDRKRAARLRLLVETEGGRAILADDAREAMRLFVRSGPDVALVELGTELCADMKALRAGRGRAVVVVGSREERQAAFGSACDAFILRQADTRPLQRTVRRFIQASRSRDVDSIEAVA